MQYILDLMGPSGNVFCVLGTVQQAYPEVFRTKLSNYTEMTYEQIIAVVREHCPGIVLINDYLDEE